MTTPYTEHMNQTASYFPPNGQDGYGRYNYNLPLQTMACRWQRVSQQFRTDKGELLTSKAIVYLSEEVVAGGYLALGDYSDETDSDGNLHPDDLDADNGYEILRVDGSPSLDGQRILYKAYL